MKANIIKSLALLLATCSLVSCQTSTAHSALKSGHWRQVSGNPPTYFPKGVAADHPTGVREGYWVSSGDEKGTRFFIPVRDTQLPTDELIAEAHASMTPAAKEELKQKQAEGKAKDVAGGVASGVAGTIGAAAYIALSAFSGMGM